MPQDEKDQLHDGYLEVGGGQAVKAPFLILDNRPSVVPVCG
jgi:hypothetical protein